MLAFVFLKHFRYNVANPLAVDKISPIAGYFSVRLTPPTRRLTRWSLRASCRRGLTEEEIEVVEGRMDHESRESK